MDERNLIKGLFICDFCRNICDGKCHELLTSIKTGEFKPGSKEYEENKDLIGRKQIIHCLGKYCDRPCKFQREEFTPYSEEEGISPLIDSLKWLVGKINNGVIEKE